MHDSLQAGLIQGGPKSKPLPNYQKVVLKPANEIRFNRQIKVSNTLLAINIPCVTYFYYVSNYAWPEN